MNRRTILPLLFGAQMFVGVVRGADDSASAIPDPEEARLSKLAEQSPKMYLPQLRDYLRQKLDVAYEIALFAAVDAEHRSAIEQAQQQWLEFYEAQRAVASYNAHGGSFATPAAMQEIVFHLRHRIYTLITPFLQGWPAAPYTPVLKKP